MAKTQRHWKVIISHQAEKVMRRLPPEVFHRIDEAILALGENPKPRGCKKLRGTRYDNHYRIQVGGWRISYAVEKGNLIVLILEVATRGDAYRF